jgi:hypothetical protein
MMAGSTNQAKHKLNEDQIVVATSRTRRIALATCRDLPAGDEDAPLLEAALESASIRPQWAVWDDPEVDWNEFDLTIIRSTWDYTAQRAEFVRWSAATPRLHNRADLISWNSDKIYLRDLAAAGLPTVPTEWIGPGEPVSWPSTEFVLKPTVGAGSKGAGRFDPNGTGSSDPARAARAHLGALHEAGRTVMLQPYLSEVDSSGEAALIYLGGRFSHAITKAAMLAPAEVNALEPGYSRSLFVPERITPRRASGVEVDLADRVLGYIGDRFEPPLYARVDLLPTPAGPVLIELELVEPSLFLREDPSGAHRLAVAIDGLLSAS